KLAFLRSHVSDGGINFTSKECPEFITNDGIRRVWTVPYLHIKKFRRHWTSEEQLAFDIIKEEMSESSLLTHDNPNKPITARCDDSLWNVSDVLSHKMEN
ncbi:hypothetical protein AHF37_03705, partial [Paragonimus kellicotti]